MLLEIDLVSLALRAGAMQLGEWPHPHYILDAAQLARFAELVREAKRELPPLPY